MRWVLLVCATSFLGCGGGAGQPPAGPPDGAVDRGKETRPSGTDARDTPAEMPAPAGPKYACTTRPGWGTCETTPDTFCSLESGCGRAGGCSGSGVCQLQSFEDKCKAETNPSCTWTPQTCSLVASALNGCYRDLIQNCWNSPACEWVPVTPARARISIPLPDLPDGGQGVDDPTGACGVAPSGGADGGTDAGGDAGTDGGTDARPPCNAVVPAGPCVAPTGAELPAPTPEGGTIVPGTYELVAVRLYGGPPSPPTQRQTLVISAGSNGTFMTQAASLSKAALARANFSLTPFTNTTSLEQFCPVHNFGAPDFTATPTSLTLFDLHRTNVEPFLAVQVSMFVRR